MKLLLMNVLEDLGCICSHMVIVAAFLFRCARALHLEPNVITLATFNLLHVQCVWPLSQEDAVYVSHYYVRGINI